MQMAHGQKIVLIYLYMKGLNSLFVRKTKNWQNLLKKRSKRKNNKIKSVHLNLKLFPTYPM